MCAGGMRGVWGVDNTSTYTQEEMVEATYTGWGGGGGLVQHMYTWWGRGRGRGSSGWNTPSTYVVLSGATLCGYNPVLGVVGSENCHLHFLDYKKTAELAHYLL